MALGLIPKHTEWQSLVLSSNEITLPPDGTWLSITLPKRLTNT